MMTTITPYSQYSVVLATYPFSGITPGKQRPAVVLSNADYHAAFHTHILMMITSREGPEGQNDMSRMLEDWLAAGLNKPSWFWPILFTLPAQQLIKQVGLLSERDQIVARRCLYAAM